MVLFYQGKDGSVENIWLTLDIEEESQIAAAGGLFKALLNLVEFILADWGWSFVCGLRDSGKIQGYLRQRLE